MLGKLCNLVQNLNKVYLLSVSGGEYEYAWTEDLRVYKSKSAADEICHLFNLAVRETHKEVLRLRDAQAYRVGVPNIDWNKVQSDARAFLDRFVETRPEIAEYVNYIMPLDHGHALNQVEMSVQEIEIL